MPKAEDGTKFGEAKTSISNTLRELTQEQQHKFFRNLNEENMRYRSMEIWYRNGCIGGFSAEDVVIEEAEREVQT